VKVRQSYGFTFHPPLRAFTRLPHSPRRDPQPRGGSFLPSPPRRRRFIARVPRPSRPPPKPTRSGGRLRPPAPASCGRATGPSCPDPPLAPSRLRATNRLPRSRLPQQPPSTSPPHRRLPPSRPRSPGHRPTSPAAASSAPHPAPARSSHTTSSAPSR
jgi:hypothetical protein